MKKARPLAKPGDLGDLVTRRFSERAVVTVGPDDPLASAYARMRQSDVSQLPVIDAGRIVEDGAPAMLIDSGRGHFAALHESWRDSLV